MSLFQRILLSTAVLMGMLLVGVFAYEKGLEEGRTGQVAVPTFQGRAASEWAQMYQDLDAGTGSALGFGVEHDVFGRPVAKLVAFRLVHFGDQSIFRHARPPAGFGFQQHRRLDHRQRRRIG